jgi:hypothetical protein
MNFSLKRAAQVCKANAGSTVAPYKIAIAENCRKGQKAPARARALNTTI